MVDKSYELKNVNIYHLHTDGDARYVQEKYRGIFQANSLFIGANVRKAKQDGRANFIPCFLSEMLLEKYFIRGTSLSEGGKPIFALASTTSINKTKIVSTLTTGAGVVTTRAHVHYIVTEWGIADLYGKSIKDRIKEMINIAHPDHRENIEREAYASYHL